MLGPYVPPKKRNNKSFSERRLVLISFFLGSSFVVSILSVDADIVILNTRGINCLAKAGTKDQGTPPGEPRSFITPMILFLSPSFGPTFIYIWTHEYSLLLLSRWIVSLFARRNMELCNLSTRKSSQICWNNKTLRTTKNDNGNKKRFSSTHSIGDDEWWTGSSATLGFRVNFSR